MGTQLLASKIVIQEEAPQVRAIQGVQTSVTAFIGVTERGPVGVATLLSSVDDYDRIFGGYVANGDVRQAVDGFYSNAGSGQIYVTRTVHYTDVTDPTTKTSAFASTMLMTGAVAAFGGFVTAANVGPYNMEPGDTLKVTTDAGGPTTTTFTATAAALESTNTEATPFALANNDTLTVQIDGGGTQTITFLTGEFVAIATATAEEVAAVINANLVGGKATASSGGTKVTITSDTRGTNSHVKVVGGTANGGTKLNFSTTIVNGTGNVGNIDAVTSAEIVTAVLSAVGASITGASVGGAPKFTRATTGSGATIAIDASSTAAVELGFDTATHLGGTGAATDSLQLRGKDDGSYANVFKGVVGAATSGEAARFNIQVLKNGIIVETWPNLTMDAADPRYVETIFNDPNVGSKYLAAIDQFPGTGAASTDRPANVTSPFLTGGNDGLAGLTDTDFTGATSSGGKTGMRCFDIIQELNLLLVPGRATAGVHNAMITYCEVTREGSMFAILDPPTGQTAESVITYFESTAGVLGLSEYGAAYWPRIKVLNPNTSIFGTTQDGNIIVAPSGYIAGMYARRDASQLGGVYNSAAGVEDGIIQGCLGFETDECLDGDKLDLVFPKRINPLTRLKNGPRFCDGARTLKGDGNFPSVPERRGAIFIEQSVKDGLQFARHKGNDEALRATVTRTVTLFLTTQMNNGAFRTTDPATAFFVDFGDALNPVSVQFAGQLIGRIGIATKKLAEYIVLRFSQDTRALDQAQAA